MERGFQLFYQSGALKRLTSSGSHITLLHTRRANALTFHIRHTYRTPPQSFPLDNQPSLSFEMLHATLQQNDYNKLSCNTHLALTSRSLKLESVYSLVVFSTITSLKQIGSQVYRHRAMLNACFIKCQQSSLP